MVTGGYDDVSASHGVAASQWHIVERSRLCLALSQSLERYRVSMIAAPAGFGKSTLIDQVTRSAGRSVIRLDSRRRVGGQAELLDHLLAQIVSPFQPGAAEATSRGTAFERVQGALATFDGIVVVDSLDGQSSFVEGLAELISGAGEATRWIVATRGGNQLPIATWAAYGVLGCIIEEDDLRFTTTEARAAAGAIPEWLAERAFQESDGWPAVFRLAVQSGEISRDGAGDRTALSLVVDFIDQQVLRGFSPEQLDLLWELALYQGLDRTALASRWPKPDLIVDEVSKATRLARLSGSKLRIEHAVAAAIVNRLQRNETYVPQAMKVARSLERVGDIPSALGMYLRAEDTVGITRLLLAHALELLDRGYVGFVRRALAHIKKQAPKNERGLKAVLGEMAALDGDFSVADRYMRDALSFPMIAEAKAELAIRFAVGAVARPHKARREALSFLLHELEALARTLSDGVPLARLLETASTMARAVLDGFALDPPLGVSVFELAPHLHERMGLAGASILLARGDWSSCGSLLRVVIAQCAANGHHRMLALAHYLSFKCEVAMRGNGERAQAIARDMLGASEAAGDIALVGRAQTYLLYTTLLSGDDAEFVRIREALGSDSRAFELNAGKIGVCDALKLAAAGSFDAAYARVVGISSDDAHLGSQTIVNALLALLAAAGGKRDASLLHVERVGPRAEPSVGKRYEVATTCLTVISLVLVGRGRSVALEIDRLERLLGALGPRDRILVKVTRALFLEHEAGVGFDPGALAPLVHGDLAFVWGIVARLSASAPKSSSRMASLTRAEVGVLRELVGGGTNAVVASRLGRSVNTVNVHVSAILRKLNCASRHEAITAAKNVGLVPLTG